MEESRSLNIDTNGVEGVRKLLKEIKENGITAFLVFVMGVVLYIITSGFVRHLEQNNQIVKEISQGISLMNNLLIKIDSSITKVDKTLDKMDDNLRKQERLLLSIVQSQEFMLLELELRRKYNTNSREEEYR